MDERPLAVCVYTPTGRGGHARYTAELLGALAELGPARRIAVSLVTRRDLAPEFRSSRYPIHAILPPLAPRERFRGRLAWGASRVVHYLRREHRFLGWVARNRPDGVHFQEYTPWLAPWHFRRLRRSGVRLFYTVHNVYRHAYPRRVPRRLLDGPSRSAWRRCDALFVHTEGLRTTLAGFLGPDHPPIHVTPHGVWSAADDLGPGPGAEERRQRKRLLFFGVIRPNKGLHVLLAAMAELPDYRLTVAGAPEQEGYRDEIRALAARLPPGQVTLIDRFVDDAEVGTLFRESSLTVLPYTAFAAQSGVLHDAIGHDTPVVATEVGALGESVRRWGIGGVAAPNDPLALAAAIRELSVPSRYRAAREAIERVRGELSWRETASATLDAYRSVLSGS